MWLINVHTYQLESFPSHDTWRQHPYVILSHTWGQDELTFQDMARLNETHMKAGFWKIHQTCEQAKHDKINYAWVDTCCIDKTSSAELQEAINSMYQWYARAAVCYVYLADIDDLPKQVEFDFKLNQQARAAANEQLRGSRWFTRGWTLQELIAPIHLEFKTRSWRPLATRNELKTILADITGIDEEVLHRDATSGTQIFGIDSLLNKYSVARRMSWAANRQTTRIEDRAYSLLGLFGVSLPLLYGEGNRAFLRLQEEILRTSPDLSLLLWHAPTQSLPDDEGPETDELAQSLLAISPDLYSSCGNLSHTLTDRMFESAAGRIISSIGLQCRLPIIFDPGDDVLAPKEFSILIVLSCYIAADPTRTMALRARLEKFSTSQTMASSLAEDSSETLYLRCHALAEALLAPRFEMIDALRAESTFTMRNVVLLRSEFLVRPVDKYSLKKGGRAIENGAGTITADYGVEYVWLRREFPVKDPPWTILHVWPEEAWRFNPPVFDATKKFTDNTSHINTSSRGRSGRDTEKSSTATMLGAIVMQRADGHRSRIMICIVCPVARPGQALPAGVSLKPIYIDVRGGEQLPTHFTDDSMRTACTAVSWNVVPMFNANLRAAPFFNAAEDHMIRLHRSVVLYEGTNVYDGSTFTIVDELRRIGDSNVAVLHAFDSESKENAF